ncbi:hypothetical protein LPJ61_003050 [Coemansia biformis]|uniref:GH18 domain-containing protein n=1 Tax=Coemansia biformis TaxID=1286918 RepID=A0A9W7YBX5_9FUNG|nr:hypothetical protein LPJ61_003050 [Coemansia biformis]
MRISATGILRALAASAPLAHGSIIAGYAPGWKSMDGVDLSRYTHINLAYAVPLANGSLALETGYNLSDFAGRVHKAGARAMLALGGWSGSVHLSDALKAGTERGRLVSGIVDCLRDNHLDGVDIDWIPNDCNRVDLHNDAPNLLAFLGELRHALGAAFPGETKLVALGVGMAPFMGPDGPLRDVSEYAKLVDYINILAYDVNGPHGNTTGPNAPLSYQAGHGSQASLVSAVDSWTAAKFPAKQITAGISFYGRAATALDDMTQKSWDIYQPRENAIPKGDDADGLWVDGCTDRTPHYSGVWSFGNLRSQGLLQSPDAAQSPWQRYWDSVSMTPWLFNPATKVFISYDDPASLAAKAGFATDHSLGGVTVYDITMDHNGELMDTIHKIITPDSPQSTSPHDASSFGQSSTAESSSSPPTPDPSSSSSSSSASPPAPGHTTAPPDHSTSSSEPVPSATSSAPSTKGTSAGGGGPQIGGQCGPRPRYKCQGEDGKAPQFAVCNAGVWFMQQCSSGTACVQSGDNIICDWPR